MQVSPLITPINLLKFHLIKGVATITGLNTLIMEINREIKKQCFKISQTICEVTGEDVLVWINTKNDELSKLQSGFPPIECEYFHAVMQEILNSEEHAILYPRCINISSTLTAPLSRENGEKAVLKWVQGGYLVKKEQYVYLGARMILEFTTYLRKNTENCICGLCAELVFIVSCFFMFLFRYFNFFCRVNLVSLVENLTITIV